jgi:HEAT repeat protein
MGKLSSAIVQRKLASLRDVEEALARQVLYGGDLATNLLEQAPAMDERALTDLLAEIHGLPPASAGELPRSPAGARLLVPGDVALRHGLYPLEQSNRTLVVAVAEPLEPDTEQDLAFGLGVTIAQRVAPLVRIRQAISRDYGMPLDRRSLRVLARLEGRPDPSPSVAPAPLASAPDMASFPRPPSIPPLGLPAPMDMSPLYAAPRAEPAASPDPPAAVLPAVAVLPMVAVGPVALAEPAMAAPGIVDAEPTRDRVSIHERLTSPAPPVAPNRDEETMSPRRAGSGQHAMPAPGLAGLAAWSAESRVADRRRAHARHRGPYTTAAAEQDLLSAEGRDDVLNAFFSFACQFFEYSAVFAVHGDLAEGRDASGPGADHAAITGIGVPLDLPSSLQTVRNEGRVNVVGLSEDGLDARFAADLLRKTGKKVLLLPVRVRDRTVLILYGDNGDNDVELSEIGDVIAFAPLVAAGLESVILRKKSAVRRAVTDAEGSEKIPQSVRPGLRPRTARTALPSRGERVEALTEALQSTVRPVSKPPPASHRLMTPPPIAGPPTPAQGTPRHASVPPRPPADATPGPVFPLSRRSSSAPPPPPEPEEDVPEISIGMSEVDWSPELPEPDSRVVVATQLPIKRYSSAELKLPTVIVNVDADIEVLVRRLIGGDESTIERLAPLGASAASVLVSHFPGPTKADSDRLGAPAPASQRGPVLRALARIGQPAVPFIAVRTSDADGAIRVLATLLLGEIPSPDSAHFVARRVTDTAAEVRRAALEAGRQLQSNDDARKTLRDKVSSLAEDTNGDIESRVAAIEALAHFRDTRTVPRLVRLVPLNDEVGQSAQWALGVITRQAFGRDTAAWDAWWSEHNDEHRIVWLIDALMHDDHEIRRAAGEELKALTKEYFGYYDDLSRKEREKAQRRYREWWEATGKARFLG